MDDEKYKYTFVSDFHIPNFISGHTHGLTEKKLKKMIDDIFVIDPSVLIGGDKIDFDSCTKQNDDLFTLREEVKKAIAKAGAK